MVVTVSHSNATSVTTETSPTSTPVDRHRRARGRVRAWSSPRPSVVTTTASTVRLQAPLKSTPIVDGRDFEGLVQLVQFLRAARRGVRLRGRGRRGANRARPDRHDPRRVRLGDQALSLQRVEPAGEPAQVDRAPSRTARGPSAGSNVTTATATGSGCDSSSWVGSPCNATNCATRRCPHLHGLATKTGSRGAARGARSRVRSSTSSGSWSAGSAADPARRPDAGLCTGSERRCGVR